MIITVDDGWSDALDAVLDIIDAVLNDEEERKEED